MGTDFGVHGRIEKLTLHFSLWHRWVYSSACGLMWLGWHGRRICTCPYCYQSALQQQRDRIFERLPLTLFYAQPYFPYRKIKGIGMEHRPDIIERGGRERPAKKIYTMPALHKRDEQHSPCSIMTPLGLQWFGWFRQHLWHYSHCHPI